MSTGGVLTVPRSPEEVGVHLPLTHSGVPGCENGTRRRRDPGLVRNIRDVDSGGLTVSLDVP